MSVSPGRASCLGLSAIVLLWTVSCRTPGSALPPASEASVAGLSDAELAEVRGALLARVREGGVNDLHARRLLALAPRFAAAEGAQLDVVQAAALLHDATKEAGEGEGKARFCTHHEQGARYARQVLLRLGKGEAFADQVAAVILEHMGPVGTNAEMGDLRFMSKFCGEYALSSPTTREAQVLYDIDMLDLMTVAGVLKVVELRQTQPEFGREALEVSAERGGDSAWKSVVDAGQTLITPSAQACGAEVRAHTRAFLDGLDWSRVTDLAAFRAEAERYLARAPTPTCLRTDTP